MAKYKVGDELIVIDSAKPNDENIAKNCFLTQKDGMSLFGWAINIEGIEYNGAEVTLSYKNASSDVVHKVFAVCLDKDNFDEQLLLEKALLKAHLQEMIKLSTMREHNLRRLR